MVGRTELVAAELRVSFASLDDWPLLRSMLAIAAERGAARGEPVLCVSATYLPEDGRLLCVFRAPTVEAVRGVLGAANLRTLRASPAISLSDLDPRPDAA